MWQEQMKTQPKTHNFLPKKPHGWPCSPNISQPGTLATLATCSPMASKKASCPHDVGEGYEAMMFYQPREPLKVWKDGNHRCKEPLGPKDWWYLTLRFHNWIASSRHPCLWWHQSTREHLRVAQIRTTLRGKKSWRDWYFGWGQMVEPFVECRCSTSNLTSTSAYITLRCEVSVGHCMPIKVCAGSELQVPIIKVHELGNVIRVAQAAS